MRVSENCKILGWLIASAIFLAGRASAQDPIRGPVLGFSPNAKGSIVWPILGIPGASILGHRLDLGSEISGAVVSPQQDYVIGIRSEDKQIAIARLISDSLTLDPLIGSLTEASVIALSPTGTVAALYGESGALQIIRGLPAAPEIILAVDTSSIPGKASAVAVSDDGSIALMGYLGADNDALWLVDSNGPRPLAAAHVSSLSFIANRHDAVVTDNTADEAYLLLGVDEAATRIPLLSALDGVEGITGATVSYDGQRAMIAGTRTGNVAVIDLNGGSPTVLSCSCRPTGVYRLGGIETYRLNEPPDESISVLDFSSGEPRILLVPPERKADSVLQGEYR